MDAKAIDGPVNFDLAASADPWQMGWEALAAIGTVLAVVVALFLPGLERHIKRKSEAARASARTRLAVHEIVVDLNEIHVHMMESLRIVMRAMNEPLPQRAATLDSAWNEGFWRLPDLAPNLSAQELEWLVDDVCQEVARLKGELYGFNRHAKRVIKGPFIKFKNANESVLAMFPTLVRNFAGLQHQCLIVMRTLRPYMTAEFDGLEASMAQQTRAFQTIAQRVDGLDADRPAPQNN